MLLLLSLPVRQEGFECLKEKPKENHKRERGVDGVSASALNTQVESEQPKRCLFHPLSLQRRWAKSTLRKKTPSGRPPGRPLWGPLGMPSVGVIRPTPQFERRSSNLFLSLGSEVAPFPPSWVWTLVGGNSRESKGPQGERPFIVIKHPRLSLCCEFSLCYGFFKFLTMISWHGYLLSSWVEVSWLEGWSGWPDCDWELGLCLRESLTRLVGPSSAVFLRSFAAVSWSFVTRDIPNFLTHGIVKSAKM